ncbi:MAG: Ser-Thr-rich GPI-anchored membrane family protein, partial [Patescibacteria group bacterium]
FSSGYHSVDVTAAADAASNTYNGAVAAISDPFTFTVMASSSSTTSSTAADATYDIDVTSPDGGETLTPGSSHTITWDSTSTGGSAMGFVNINLMYSEDGASTQTTIVTATTNDGSYSWTVPDIDTDGATIQIVGTDLVDALATNESDDTFTIGSVDSTDDTDDEVTVDEEDESTSETTGLSPVTGEMEAISAVSYGDYVRSSYFSTVYYIDMDEDGTLVRRPFMDAQTFMTWQSDWDDVGTITDATLPTMELGGPMLPKAGIVLVKIQSDARVFAIEGDGTIRWITSEAVAIANYGSNWADYVIDVAPTMFPRFTQGDDLDSDENGDTGIMKTRAVVNM